ncbi:Integrase core domain-containing protein [Sphingobium faniae]|nr:Integrase core domain-containing protein [Sphingobium faniae]
MIAFGSRRSRIGCASSFAIHTVLTDNGIQFTNQARHKYAFHHIFIFDGVCDERNIEHRLTKLKHPWTNGQIERMNRDHQGSDGQTLPLR